MSAAVMTAMVRRLARSTTTVSSSFSSRGFRTSAPARGNPGDPGALLLLLLWAVLIFLFFPSLVKNLSLVSLSFHYYLYYSGKWWLSFFLIYRAQNTFTRKKCTRSETFRRRNLSTGWASRVVSRLRRAFPFLRWTFNKQKEDDLVDFCTNDNRERERQTEGIRRRVTGAAGERFKTTTVTNNSTCCNVNVPCIPWQWSRFPFSSAIVLQRREFPRAFRFLICTRNSTGY